MHRGQVPGLLSIVVPCYNVEEYLDQCLASLRFQDYRDIEIVVVDDGSPDASGAIARSHRRRDLRVRLVRRPNGGLSAARNTGVAHARGEFLTFVDSDDVVAPDAYGRVVDTLRESGSDFAVSLYDRVEIDTHRHAERWIRRAHRYRRLGTNVDDFPEIMVNAVAWSKVYRRSFWDETGLSFPEGKLYEDQPVSSAAFAAAASFDVLPEVTVSWRIRGDKSSISQQKTALTNLAAHNETVAASLGALADRGRKRAVELRAVQLLTNNMPFFSRHILQGDDGFWRLLREGVGLLVDQIPPADYERLVAAQNKVLNRLIVDDRREDAEAFLAQFGQEVRRFPTRVSGDRVCVDLPFSDSVAATCSVLSETQLDLFARVLRARWDEGTLTVAGWAFIRNLDLTGLDVRIEVDLVRGGAVPIPLEVHTFEETRAREQGDHWHADYGPGGFAARLDVSRLPREPGAWSLHLRLSAGPVTRETDIDDLSVAGSASVDQAWLAEDGLRYIVAKVPSGPFGLQVDRPAVRLTGHRVGPDGRLHLEYEAPGSAAVLVAHRRSPGSPATTATSRPLKGGSWEAEVNLMQLPGASPGSDGWSVLVAAPHQSQPEALVASSQVPVGPLDCDASGSPWLPARDHRGRLVLEACQPMVATGVDVADDVLTIHCSRSADVIPVLRAHDVSVEGTCASTDAGTTLVLRLSRDLWGRSDLALPPGKYGVFLRQGTSTVPLAVADGLLSALPQDLPGSRNHVRVEVFAGSRPRLAIKLLGPLEEDERGERSQHLLRESCRTDHAEMDSVFFRALYGEAANCNMLGVHQELLRRGSTLRLLWSITDYSVPVPPGGEAVIEGSRAWHEAVARSRYHMVNVHQLPWFTKPEGQVMIETMHGYPYKVMGHEWWAKGRFPANQVLNYDRRAREWDYFVSPASYATPLLRKAFLDPAHSTAEVLEIGYPRNDVLQGEQAEELRARTRDALGIRPDQTVVLYAPTFRDYLSTDDMAAAPVDFLDLARASRKLGDGFVFLMRGHAFNARAKARFGRGTRIIDVTTHPDVNELIVASDVAVLDYSSIRFDYAITGKPMIFLVPDLERYDRGRGGVIPYAPTAPGPQVASTRAVIGHLRNLSALTRDYADAIRQFRASYVDLDDGHASERLVDAVFVPRGDAARAG